MRTFKFFELYRTIEPLQIALQEMTDQTVYLFILSFCCFVAIDWGVNRDVTVPALLFYFISLFTYLTVIRIRMLKRIHFGTFQ